MYIVYILYTLYMIVNCSFLVKCSKTHSLVSPHASTYNYTNQLTAEQDLVILKQTMWTTSRNWPKWEPVTRSRGLVL